MSSSYTVTTTVVLLGYSMAMKVKKEGTMYLKCWYKRKIENDERKMTQVSSVHDTSK